MSNQPASVGVVPIAATAAQAEPVLGSVTSADGTSIGYRRFGGGPGGGPSGGPGLVLLHGSMSSGAHHVELATLLSDSFTVYVPDRRGRGLSGPYRTGDELR